MNWITSIVRPKIQSFLKRETPENLWIKCPESGQMVFHKDVEQNLNVIPGSGYHMHWGAEARLRHMFDGGAFEDVLVRDVPSDPLKFRDTKRYADRLKEARTRTAMTECIRTGFGTLDGTPVTISVQDSDFIMGSIGMGAGEAIIAGLEEAVRRRTAYIIFTASGGARMQEGIFSLMQMPRTTVAVQRLKAIRKPYIVVLTNPTTGGVTASYGMLGDIHIAEPGALICFAGPRVIEATVREKLPEGFQRAEYLKDHGMVDMVVDRHQMRGTLSRLVSVLTKMPVEAPADIAAMPEALPAPGSEPAEPKAA